MAQRRRSLSSFLKHHKQFELYSKEAKSVIDEIDEVEGLGGAN